MKKRSFANVILIIFIMMVASKVVHAQGDGVTALVEAVKSDKIEEVKRLIEKGVDVNANDDKGFTPLAVAAANGYTEIVKLLVDKGADIQAETTFGVSALKFAAYQGHMETVKLLLDRGARIDAKNGDGSTALEWAAGSGQTETVRLLLDRGADINAKDEQFSMTALMSAARKGHIEVVKLLLARGADIKLKEVNGKTAAIVAAEADFHDIAKLIEGVSGLVNSADSEAHPILDWGNRIMGGTLKGKWLSRGEIAALLQGGEKYKFYSQDRFLGEFEGSKPIKETYLSGDIGYRVANLKNKNEILSDSIVGISGTWNALPRIPKIDKKSNFKNDKFINELLKSNHISKPADQISTSIYIDLENDGVQEVFLIVSNITDQMIDDFCNGKEVNRDNLYSFIVLRKTIQGKEQNTVIAADFKKLIVNEMEFIADADGDGQMEFLIRRENIEVTPAEGFSTRYQDLYDIENNQIKKLFSNFGNPI